LIDKHCFDSIRAIRFANNQDYYDIFFIDGLHE